MSLSAKVSDNMHQVQKLFLEVQEFMFQPHSLEEIISFLDAQPLIFRSVGYESASFMMGMKDLEAGNEMENLMALYKTSLLQHSFHMDIGLGWAFAKSGTLPGIFFPNRKPVMREMVFDGIGYYHGLFKGRRTVREPLVPEGIAGTDLWGFDQGLGRRLWYMAKGNVDELSLLMESFPAHRHPALWSGVGIACGYVGGSIQEGLELLLKYSGESKNNLQTGIILALMSRQASGSIGQDLETACRVICNKTTTEIEEKIGDFTKKYFYIYNSKAYSSLLTEIESILI